LVRKLVTFGVPTTREAARRIGLLLIRAGTPERHAHIPTNKHERQVQRSDPIREEEDPGG